MTPYRFVTQLRTTATPDEVHGALLRPEAWATGWGEAVHIVRVAPGDDQGAGSVFEAAVRAPAGYAIAARVEIIEATRPVRLVARLTGDLVGTGTWTFRGDEAGTVARLDMTASTTRRWMNAAAPLSRPLFEWSHRIVMRHAARAATDHLGADLLAFRSTPVR
ncbi:MAG TPA: hypothetical protein VGA36_09130 [Nitriliruptorales bacterium]